MIGGKKPHGFTIMETMMFLAISGVLLVSAIALINGKQNKTEFGQGIRQIQNNLQSVISNVATGHYVSNNLFSCNGSSGSLSVTAGANANGIGANFGCQYVGEAIQFAPQGHPDQYVIYPVVGKQYQGVGSLTPASTITDASPKVLGTGDTNGTYDSQTTTLPYGIEAAKIQADSGAVGTIGFFSLSSAAKSSASGTNDVTLIPFSDGLNEANSTSVDTINGVILSPPSTTYDPANGIKIYFQSATTVQCGVITIGANGNPSSVDLAIQNGNCT